MAIQPFIFWGLDKSAARIAKKFVTVLDYKTNFAIATGNRLHSKHSDTGLYRFFDSEKDDPTQEFRDAIIDLRESVITLEDCSEPGVVLFSSSFTDDSETYFQIIGEVDRILKVTLPGSQSISLVVLLPPPTAGNHEKINTFKYFLQLENVAWAIPFLDIIFIHQLSRTLYDNENEDTDTVEPLFELLYGELLDTDLGQSIERFGYPAISNRNEAKGRKFCYSTTGLYRLIYYPDECIKRLKAKFKKELFETVFNNKITVLEDEKTLEILQKRSDLFVLDLVEKLESEVPKSHKISDAVLEHSLENNTSNNKIKEIKKDIYRIINTLKTDFESWQDKLNEIVNEEFCDLLNQPPGYLAGAGFYSDSLSGRRLYSEFESANDQPSGIELFSAKFCIAPLHQNIETFYKSFLNQLELSIPLSFAQESEQPWLYQFAEYADNEMSQDSLLINRTIYKSIFLLKGSIEKKDLFFPDSTWLIEELMLIFQEDLENVDASIQINRDNKAKADLIFEDLEKELGFLGRNITNRKRYKNAVNERNQTKTELDNELTMLISLGRSVQFFFIELFNQIILPNISRVLFKQGLLTAVDTLKKKYKTYVKKIENDFSQQLKAAVITELKTSTETTILNKKILDVLYKPFRKKIEALESPDDILKFCPMHLSDAAKKKLPYYNCHNLKDHYVADVASLQSRIEHYANDTIKPVGKKNIIDILEIEGRSDAEQYLKKAIDKLNKFVLFSPGFFPIALENNLMNSILISKTHRDINTRLMNDYSFSFEPETALVNSDDPFTIELTALSLGFPAFLIHGLSECRELFLEQERQGGADLWPVITI